MSSDVAISPISQRSAAPPPQTAPASPFAAPVQPDPASVAAASKRPLVNPSLHLDLALNLVVLQFVDDKGDVTSSIPSVKQLKAYKAHQSEPAAKAAAPSPDHSGRGP